MLDVFFPSFLFLRVFRVVLKKKKNYILLYGVLFFFPLIITPFLFYVSFQCIVAQHIRTSSIALEVKSPLMR